jgi:hypothetical protein
MGYSLDGEANVTVIGNITLYGLATGLHNITVYAIDSNGLSGGSELVTFTIEQQQMESFPSNTNHSFRNHSGCCHRRSFCLLQETQTLNLEQLFACSLLFSGETFINKYKSLAKSPAQFSLFLICHANARSSMNLQPQNFMNSLETL